MNKAKKKRTDCFSKNNKGMLCPFKATICQEGWCINCQIYKDREKEHKGLKKDPTAVLNIK
jgi:hypothetical protein